MKLFPSCTQKNRESAFLLVIASLSRSATLLAAIERFGSRVTMSLGLSFSKHESVAVAESLLHAIRPSLDTPKFPAPPPFPLTGVIGPWRPDTPVPGPCPGPLPLPSPEPPPPPPPP